jgi:hypothetical protein
MAQIEYCDEDVEEPSWHPAFDPESCAVAEWLDERPGLVSSWGIPALIPAYSRQSKVEREFQQLASRWKRETAIYGHLSKIVMHPDYQRIMAMGPEVISSILKDLDKKPAHWFWALHNLVPHGQDPAEGLTTIEEARLAWLKWGRDNEYL